MDKEKNKNQRVPQLSILQHLFLLLQYASELLRLQ